MESVGIKLRPYIDNGLLQIHSSRPTLHGLEMHLLTLNKLVRQFKPQCVIIDPISNLISVGSISEVRAMLVRLIDLLKLNNITALFTSLTQQNVSSTNELTEESVSSLVDTWITVRDVEGNSERNRGLYILKSRGMGHSNQVREFVITDKGIKLLEFELGPEGVLTGSERIEHKLNVSAEKNQQETEKASAEREIARRKKVLEGSIEALKVQFESASEELNNLGKAKPKRVRMNGQSITESTTGGNQKKKK
jgi:circadian clock protein KaiC